EVFGEVPDDLIEDLAILIGVIVGVGDMPIGHLLRRPQFQSPESIDHRLLRTPCMAMNKNQITPSTDAQRWSSISVRWTLGHPFSTHAPGAQSPANCFEIHCRPIFCSEFSI